MAEYGCIGDLMSFKNDFMQGFYDSLDLMVDWDNAKHYTDDVQELIENLYDVFRYDVAKEIEEYMNNKLGE